MIGFKKILVINKQPYPKQQMLWVSPVVLKKEDFPLDKDVLCLEAVKDVKTC